MAKADELAQDALDARAKQILVTKCRTEILDGETWYNVYQTTCYVEIVSCSKYLRLRGLADAHPEKPFLIRLREQ